MKSYLFKIAWRESRGSRRKILFFMFSVTLAVAALTALGSLADTLRHEVENGGRVLLGADLSLRSSQPPTAAVREFVAALPGEKANEINLSSMAYFPVENFGRLAQVRALSGGYPFYGELSVSPADAAAKYLSGAFALVERTLMLQAGAKVGETIRLGEKNFQIAGVLEKLPGDSPVGEIIAPRIVVGEQQLSGSGLLERGSRANYRTYFKIAGADDTRIAQLVKSERTKLDDLKLVAESFRDRERRMGSSIDDIYSFLRLAGIFALMLSALGVGSGTYLYCRGKIRVASILRVLGMTSAQAQAVFLIQLFAAAILSSALGVAVGTALENSAVRAFHGLLPLDVPAGVSLQASCSAFLLGCLFTIVPAVIVLMRLRLVPPLALMRAGQGESLPDDPQRWRVRLFCLLALFAICRLQAGSTKQAAVFFGLSLATMAALLVTGRLLLIVARILARDFLPYPIRQGCLDLFRPNNQTGLMILVTGTATLIVSMLWSTERLLLDRVTTSAGGSHANLVLFDVQPEEVEPLRLQVTKRGGTVFDVVPVVTMRIASIDGRSVSRALADDEPEKKDNDKIPDWTLRREYRSTYRNFLTDSEKLSSGEFPGVAEGAAVPVSLEAGIAEKLNAHLASRIVFDVQGRTIETVVASLREVEWTRVQPNFFVIFPPGVLEDAPQFRIITARIEAAEESAALSREVLTSFPGVSIIDLTNILGIIDEVLAHFTSVLEAICAATFLVALGIMIAVLRGAARERESESALLRVLGASSRQLLTIATVEYFLLGIFGGLSGAICAVAGSAVIASWLLSIKFHFALLPFAVPALVAAILCLTLGGAGALATKPRRPLEVLQSE